MPQHELTHCTVLSTSGEEQERKDAVKVMRLLERGRHWVLVVLLLSNVVVNEVSAAPTDLGLP